MKKKLVYGVGINDADYICQPTINGKRVICKFYSTWTGMLERGYSEILKAKNPTYEGVYVCEAWHTFSNFKAWMEGLDWQGKQLDKDLIVPGNKVYSPEFCVFIPSHVNTFLCESGSIRGEWPIGVSWYKPSQKYRAQISGRYSTKGKSPNIHIGLFDTPEQAHEAWLTEKRKQAMLLVAELSDARIIKAIIERYGVFYEEDH